MATLTTDLGDLNGTLISIQGDIAHIETAIGDVLISLRSLTEKTKGTSLWWVLVVAIIVAATSGGISLLMKRRKINQQSDS
jgi:hypothetical protein